MKKYIVPEAEYVIVSSQEDILTGSGNVDGEDLPPYGTTFTF